MFIVDESVQFICGGEGSDIYISIRAWNEGYPKVREG